MVICQETDTSYPKVKIDGTNTKRKINRGSIGRDCTMNFSTTVEDVHSMTPEKIPFTS